MMKKIFKITVTAIILAALAVSMISCSQKSEYEQLLEDGYTVKVIFDTPGARVNGRENSTIVELYKADDVVTNSRGETGIKILDPLDPLRQSSTGNKDMLIHAEKVYDNYEYSLIGWYTHRETRKDAEGNVLDAFGEKVSVSGREAGYIYSNRWDFENDVIDVDSLENGEFTLYAAFIPPYVRYEIYAQNENGSFDEIYNNYGTIDRTIDFIIPQWIGSIQVMNSMVQVDGKMFDQAYFDPELTMPITENILVEDGLVDMETGIATQKTIKIYTTWRDLDWIPISSASDLMDELCYGVSDYFDESVTVSGRFFLVCDIDFSSVTLSDKLQKVIFDGVIDGNGFEIKNMKNSEGVFVNDLADAFGEVTENAVFDDVIVKNDVIKD